jgi:hypothetical protein
VKYTVIRKHRPESSEILSAFAGDELRIMPRETHYPGWIWCKDEKGAQAWVPKEYVSIVGNQCRMKRDYISRELELEVGEQVDLLEIESEWAWVLDRRGVYGWIPMECLERVETDEVPD